MPRHKKNEFVVRTASETNKKNMTLIPYHISAEFKPGNLCPEDIFSSKYPTLIVKILEIPDFTMSISTWNPTAEYISNCCTSNGEYIRYNGRVIRDHIGKAFGVTPSFKLNTKVCGDSVPSDITDFFTDIFEEYVEEDKTVNENGWGDNCNEIKYGIPISKIGEIVKRLTGIAMGRTTQYHAQHIKSVIFEVKDTDDVVDDDD